MPRKINSSWIVEHSSSLAKISAAPNQFHMWAAISVVGAVLKNHVKIKYATYEIYPNQFIVLTAPPGIGKGTAIHAAWDYAKDPDLANVITDRVTAPKILEKLAQGQPAPAQMNANGQMSIGVDSSATLMSPELATLLGSSDWMLTFLCDAWDRKDYSYDTKNSGTAVVKGMCTSLIGGCVPDYIRRLNKDAMAAISGGFTARTIFVYADKVAQSIPWPEPLSHTSNGRKIIDNLKHDLQDISRLKGEFKFSIAVQQQFANFFQSITPLDDDSDVILYFKSRMHVHVLKCSMIFAAARNNNLLVESEDMQNAIYCLRSVLGNINKTFRGVGDSDLAEATARVQTFVEKRGNPTRNEILANVHRHVSPENLGRILYLLEQIGFIKSQNQGGKVVYTYIGKDKVSAPSFNDLKFTKP